MVDTERSARLRAAGLPITLDDGREVRVRFGMESLVQIEDQFGSLGAVQRLLGNLDENQRVFGPMLDLLAAGLAHEGITRQELLRDDLVPPTLLAEFAGVIGRAFMQAFPQPSGEAEAAPTPPTEPSPGMSGITSAPSPSAALTASSG